MNVAESPAPQAAAVVEGWLARLNARKLDALFERDCHWRDLAALGRRFGTVSNEAVVPALASGLDAAGARNFRLAEGRCGPERLTRAGVEVIEALIAFDLDAGVGEGVVRLLPETGRAWTFATALDRLAGARAPISATDDGGRRDFHGPNWADRRREGQDYADRDPEVLIVGGGHAGLTTAARLGRLGIDALVVDRMARVGDNWRLRYRNLMLHNQKNSNQMPLMPFPDSWPAYIPKDKIANWLEIYVEALEINFWTRTEFEGARRDDDHWWAVVVREGARREMKVRHIVMATSVSAIPKLPEIPTLERFGGEVVHSSGYADGARLSGRPAVVVGTGTSAHDIAQDLHAHGARVTMVQRSPTLVVNVEPAQLYDGIYFGPGPSLEDRDLLNVGTPFAMMKRAHRQITDKVRELDRPLLEGLEKAGFRLDFGEDGTGWPLKYRTRGGGYYFNIGCSDLIASGEIGLVQAADIETFREGGLTLKDGREVDADLVVLATGYEGQARFVRRLFGDEVADRVGQVWGFDDRQEVANMWTRTPQEGLWFTAGAFSQCRMFSKYLALQIAQDELER